jgi:hypothetical protein
MDLKAITTALALRYAAANVTPPAGRTNITGSTGTPPNNIPNTPFVIVWPDEGTVTVMSGRMAGEHTMRVCLYLAKREGDIPREAAALQDWLGVLLGQTFAQTKLGLGPAVMKALPVSWAMGTLLYAGDEYDGITITVHVWTEENVTLVP